MAASAHARILIIGLWTECDDQGVFEWKPLTLKARLLPADGVDVGDLLNELGRLNLLCTFAIDGKTYGAVRNFRKFQRPKKPKHAHRLPDELIEYVGRDEEESDPTHLLRKRKCEEQGGRCFYCRCEITHYAKRHNSLDMDHVIPLSRGGLDCESNLVAACRTCNRGKGGMTGDEFRAAIAKRMATTMTKSHAKSSDTNASGELAPQMEDGGWRMENNLNSSLRSELSVDPILKSPDDEALAFEAFNALAERIGLPQAQLLTPERRSRLRQRLAECGGMSGWGAALAKVEASSHCRGGGSRGWRANLDFMLQKQSFRKLMEGNYDDHQSSGDLGSSPAGRKPSPGGNLPGGIAAAVAQAAARFEAERGVRPDGAGIDPWPEGAG